MELFNFLKDNAGLNVTINAGQLFEAINYAVNKTKTEFEAKETPEILVTRKNAAEQLKVDLSTLYLWGRRNYLVPIKKGKKVLYKQSDIDVLLNGGTLL